MKSKTNRMPKRDHRIVIRDFFGLGKNLEAWQIGWDIENRFEAKTSVSRKIFEYYVETLGMNLIFYNLEDRNFYGIHAEECPTPVFRFPKNLAEPIPCNQFEGDTHNYAEGEILYMVDGDDKIWDVVKINGKNLEEVLQNSYIMNIG